MNPIEPDRFEDGRPMLLAGIRRHHGFAESARTVPAQWEEFRRVGESIPGARLGTAYGAFCGVDMAAQTFEYMCALEVASFDGLPRELGRVRVPPVRYAVFVHRGPAAGIRDTWSAIMDGWLPRSGYRSADTPDFEKYDARFDPRAASGEVEIWLGVRPE